MGLSDKLYNSTPFDARIPYDRNYINIPGDGYVQVRAQQLEDFMPGRPGTEEVRALLNSYGCFLFDTDKSFDIQMLDALKAFVKDRDKQYKDFIDAQVADRVRAGAGQPSEEDLAPVIQRAGLDILKSKIETCRSRAAKLETELRSSGELNTGRAAPKFDPERTSFGTSPPREFPTTRARDAFHDVNLEARERHEKFVAAMEAQSSARVATAR